MTAIDMAEAIVVGALDVEVSELHGSRFTVTAGPHRFVISASRPQWESLRRAITEVVPKLTCSRPVRDQITAEEHAQLRPHMKQLMSMGVLLEPKEHIGSYSDLRLYGFIARRSESPDETYASLKRKAISVEGPAAVAGTICEVLKSQGLTLADAADPALTIVMSVGDAAALVRANERLCGEGRSLLPVLVTPRYARLGPWTIPGESACLNCMPSGGASARKAAAGTWPTTQPGFAHWIGGMIAHLALRAFLPMGGEHPWGRVTTVDAVTGKQTSHRAWRNPYCTACAERSPVAQEWAEL